MTELTPRQLDALNRIERKPALQPFFFRKLKGMQWFDELELRGFFSPERHPAPVESDKEGYFTIPSWPILDYLERTAPELLSGKNHEYADKYLLIIRNVTRSAMANGVSNYRTWWYFSKIVKHISIDKIEDDDIELFEYWLSDRFDQMLVGIELGEKFLGRLLYDESEQAKRLSIGLIRALTKLVWAPRRWGATDELEASLPVEAHHSERIFAAHAKNIGARLEEAGLEVFRERLAEILSRSNKDKHSYIWRPAIEDHEQNSEQHDPENILVSALRDALTGYIDRRAAAATDYVRGMLRSETVVLQRLALNAIGLYGQHLVGALDEVNDQRFFTHHFQHEMYHLLRNQFSKFEERKKTEVINIIELAAEKSVDASEPQELQTKQRAYALVRWLSAIRGKGWRQADELYAKHLAVVGDEPEHPDFAYFTTSGWIGDVSPCTAEDLLSRDFGEVLKMLQAFVEEEGWDKPTRRGLAQTLQAALKSKPDFFEGRYEQFIGLHYDYLYHLIEGYKDLWKETQYDNWEEMLCFCSTLLNSDGFWDNGEEERAHPRRANRRWIVGAVGELIRGGTANDEMAFRPEFLPLAKDILLVTLRNQEGESFEGKKDAVAVAINSARGKCVEALINYSLRRCRLADQAEGTHTEVWASELQPTFDQEVARSREGNREFVTLFAYYLPNFLYLDRAWVMSNLPAVFDKQNRDKWLCAMQGYTYVNRIYPEVYLYLRDESHFRAALDAEEIKSSGKGKIIQNAVIAYIQGEESLGTTNGLLDWMLNRWKLEELQGLTWFVWTLRGGKQESVAEKFIALWADISERADESQETDRHILSGLCMWSVFLEDLNECSMDLILKAAPYADLGHHGYILVGELKRLVERYPAEVADVFARILEKFAPTYQQEDIERILSTLYEKGGDYRQAANTICDKYVEYGIAFPSEIRSKFA